MIRKLKIYPSIDKLKMGHTDQVTFASYLWNDEIKNKLKKDLQKYYKNNDNEIITALKYIGFSEFRTSKGWLLKDKKLKMENHEITDFTRVVAQLEPVTIFIEVNARKTVSVKIKPKPIEKRWIQNQ